MYTPPAFKITDPNLIHTFLAQNSFGVLITAQQGEAPTGTHLPFLFDWSHGPNGRLCAHMARANPHWRVLQGMHDKVEEALVIFFGAHGYVSPRYYEPGPAVPTWNYETAHVYGVPSLPADTTEFRHHLETLAAFHEGDAVNPWRMENEDPQFIEKMMAAIVPFEIDITRIEMKAKMSQNKPEKTQQKVVESLRNSSYVHDHTLADAMKRYLSNK